MYPERFSHLPEYAFPRLRALLDGHDYAGPKFNMTIGEPQHRFPLWIKDVLLEHLLRRVAVAPHLVEAAAALRRVARVHVGLGLVIAAAVSAEDRREGAELVPAILGRRTHTV